MFCYKNYIFRFIGINVHRPRPAATAAWCFTTDPETEWDYCDIRDCVECDHSKNYYHQIQLLFKLNATVWFDMNTRASQLTTPHPPDHTTRELYPRFIKVSVNYPNLLNHLRQLSYTSRNALIDMVLEASLVPSLNALCKNFETNIHVNFSAILS